MDLYGVEGLNGIRPSIYRVSMKLLSLQKLFHMDIVSLRHITTALHSVSDSNVQRDWGLNTEEVTQTLNRMFRNVSHEVAGRITVEATDKICSLMFQLYDPTHTGSLTAASLQTALIVLSADSLLLKYRALVGVAEDRIESGSISRSGLRSLLQDLSQVPAAVQEEGLFQGVEDAVKSCFNGVFTSRASEQHVLSWLQSEPPLLIWLPTLYRLSVSQNVHHSIHCHICKTFPITGLRYRCMKCVNVHVCQKCFLTDRQTRKHKSHHPVLEFCTQPTWREALSSLVHSTRHALLPRRYTQQEGLGNQILMWAKPAETQSSAPPPTDPSTQLDVSGISHCASSAGDVPNNASVSSKCLQTEEEAESEQQKAMALITEVRNLQRDKWLLEQQLQAWRVTVQSEQGILEDRCSELEVTMETLRKHNVYLQDMLKQALNKMDGRQQADNTQQRVAKETKGLRPTSDAKRDTVNKEEEDVLLKTEDEGSEEELQSPSPTMHQDKPPSQDLCSGEEEESVVDTIFCHPGGRQDRPEEVGPQEEDICLSEDEKEDCGASSPEVLLQETMEILKTEMETDRWKERQTGERKWAELLEAADKVGDSIHHLLDAARTNTDAQ